jgi:hypothetical protein
VSCRRTANGRRSLPPADATWVTTRSNTGPWRERPPFWAPWSANPAASEVVAHATLVIGRASSAPRCVHHFEGPSTSILRFADRALKALRFAAPALRAAGGLDRAIREPSTCRYRRPAHTLLTPEIHSATLEVSSMVALCAAPSASPDAERTNQRSQIVIRALLLDTFLVDRSRDVTSANQGDRFGSAP